MDLEFLKRYNEHSLAKLDKVKKSLGKRKGPNIIWLKEREDDSRLAFPDVSWKNGIPTMARALNDFEEGIAVIAGKANSGKSTLLVNMMLDSLELNEDLMVLDFSFDDPYKKRYQQYIASRSGLPYQYITTDDLSDPMMQRARLNADALIEKFYSEDRLRTFESIEFWQIDNNKDPIQVQIRRFDNIVGIIENTRKQYPSRKIVAFIDALNNIDLSKSTRDNGFSSLELLNDRLAQLQERSQKTEAMIVVSSHLRKAEASRKPGTAGADDVKGTNDLVYNAAWIALVKNEYREKIFDKPLMYTDPVDQTEYPVIAVEVLKTKVSAWDHPLYYVLKSGSCGIESLTRQEYITYDSVVKSKRT